MSRFFYWDEGWVLCVCAGEQLTREKAPPASDTNPHISPSTKYKWESVYKLKHGYKSKHKLKHIHRRKKFTQTRGKWCKCKSKTYIDLGLNWEFLCSTHVKIQPNAQKHCSSIKNMLFSSAGGFWQEFCTQNQLPREYHRPHLNFMFSFKPLLALKEWAGRRKSLYIHTRISMI